MLSKIGVGTYGVVYRAKGKKTREIVAVKKLKAEMVADRKKPLVFRPPETDILTSLNHPSIIDLKHVVVGNDAVALLMVMEYVESDLNSLLSAKKQPFTLTQIKCLMQRSYKESPTSTIIRCDNPCIPHTEPVVSLWYREPELLLGAKHYSTLLFDGTTEIDQSEERVAALTSTQDVNESSWQSPPTALYSSHI